MIVEIQIRNKCDNSLKIIKEVKAIFGLGLKEAKDMVDANCLCVNINSIEEFNEVKTRMKDCYDVEFYMSKAWENLLVSGEAVIKLNNIVSKCITTVIDEYCLAYNRVIIHKDEYSRLCKAKELADAVNLIYNNRDGKHN